MKKLSKKILYTTMALAFTWMPFADTTPAYAACDAVTGVLTSATIGNIYLSDADWDAANPSTTSPVSFSVNYDASASQPFFGQAWNETLGWKTFVAGNTATFAAMTTAAWGGVENSFDLSGVTVNGSSMSGTATMLSYTGQGNDTNDWLVGAQIDFSGATLSAGAGTCTTTNPEINLFVNGNTSYTAPSCGTTTVSMTWTTADVHSCETDAGPWSSSGARPIQNTTGESLTATLVDGSSVSVQLRCLRNDTNAVMASGVNLNCTGVGNPPPPPPPPTGGISPDFIES